VLGRKLIGIGQLYHPLFSQLDHHSSVGASCLAHRLPRGLWPIWLTATILVVYSQWLVGHGVGGPGARPWLLSASFGCVQSCIVASQLDYVS
jgi:hypothetical protein